MPGFNGTGPDGRGPMTGGGFGYCTGYAKLGDPIRPAARGFFGRGFRGRMKSSAGGRGRGYQNMYYATGLPGWIRYGRGQTQNPQASKEDEIQYLEQQLEGIKKRLSELRGD